MRTRPGLVLAVLALPATVLSILAGSTVSNVAVAQVNGTPPSHEVKYYLTKGYFTGDQVLHACAKGYHLASRYESDRFPGAYNPELGVRIASYQWGPPISDEPSEAAGWIDNGEAPGRGENCNGWNPDPLCPACYRGAIYGIKTGSGNADCTSESWRVWCISNP